MEYKQGPIVIRLELEGIRHQVGMMLHQQALDVDAYIKSALDEFCTDASLAALVRKVTREVVSQKVKSAIEDFFRYGIGGQAVDAAIKTALVEALPATIKDL